MDEVRRESGVSAPSRARSARAQGPTDRVDVDVADVDDLGPAVLDAWHQLRLASNSYASPFLAPEWAALVGRHMRGVKVAVGYQGSQPVAMLPFQPTRPRVAGPVGGRLNDVQGWIIDDCLDPDPVAFLRSAGLVAWDFDHLPACRTELHRFVSTWEDAPAIDLTDGYDAYARQLTAGGGKVLKKAATAARRIERDHGQLVFSWHDDDPEALDLLLCWKSAQYRRTGITDGIAQPGVEAVLRGAAGGATGVNGVVATIRASGRVVAAHLGLRSGRLLHYWFPAYDPELAELSPGTVLLQRLAEHAPREDVTRIDLGKGEHGYKLRFANDRMAMGTGTVERATLRTIPRRARRLARSVPWLRTVKQRLSGGRSS